MAAYIIYQFDLQYIIEIIDKVKNKCINKYCICSLGKGLKQSVGKCISTVRHLFKSREISLTTLSNLKVSQCSTYVTLVH